MKRSFINIFAWLALAVFLDVIGIWVLFWVWSHV